MPELPEVETIRSQLAPLVQGRTLARVEILDPRWSRPLEPRELSAALEGRRVQELARRGKYLVWHLSGDVHLLQHLRMTGAVLLEPEPEPAHVRVRLSFEPKRELVITDARRFGTGELLLGEPALEAFLAERLGIEPLADEFTRSACASWRADVWRRSRRSCSTSASSPASATSMPTRRCFARASTRCRPAGRLSRSSTPRCATRRRRAASGDRRARRLDRRLPPCGRPARRLSGSVPGVRSRRRAVPALRHDDLQAARRRPRHARVRALPAAPAARAGVRPRASSSSRPSSAALASSA